MMQQPASNRRRQLNRTRYRPQLECLEDRVVPSAIRTIREATAAGPQANAQVGIQATVDTFRADLGNPVNGNAVGSQGAGRREITWDGGDNDAAPARLPANFFNAVAPRGVIFNSDPRISFQVSADATPTVPGTLPEFGNINATYPTAFSTFSSPRLFTAQNSNVIEVEFFIPGTLQRATVSGFGAVFTDVDVFGSSKIEYFDGSGREIFERTVLATSGNESLSFLGVTFVGAPVAKVRITSGDAPVGPSDITQGGTFDIVVMDNFLYGEPQPLPDPRIIAGTGSGARAQVRVFNGRTGTLLHRFFPFGGFQGGVRVATGDVTGDGVADIITAPGPARAPVVKVFDGSHFGLVRSFLALGRKFRGGVNVATGDIDGDGLADIIVGTGKGAGQVKVFSGANQQLLYSFFAFGPRYKGGVTVAAGDINGDFLADIIAGQQNGGSRISVFSGVNGSMLSSVFAFGGFKGGVTVATGDVDGDGRVDIISGMGPGGKSFVKVFNAGGALIRTSFVFGVNLRGGLNVASTNVDNDRLVANIIAVPGEGGPPRVRIVGIPLSELDSFFAFAANFKGGVFVAASR